MLFLHKICDGDFSCENLPEIIVKKIESKKVKADKEQSLSAYNSIYKLLTFLKIEDEISFLENGKPFLKKGRGFISLSHSGDYVLCGVSKKLIGVDIEKFRPINLRVARRFCSERELESCTDLTTFFRLWTLKEAYYKIKGEVDDIKKIEFSFCGDSVICSDKKIKAKSFVKNDVAIAVCEEI